MPPKIRVAFVPNSFVQTNTGSAPLARLLNAGEIDALMLTLRLYRRQNLMEAGGVPLEDIVITIRPCFAARSAPIRSLPSSCCSASGRSNPSASGITPLSIC